MVGLHRLYQLGTILNQACGIKLGVRVWMLLLSRAFGSKD